MTTKITPYQLRRCMNAIIKLTLLFVMQPLFAADQMRVIHDAHIHYDEDVWEALPPRDAIRVLNSLNIRRAMVSATPTEGAEKLYHENPEVVIPMLRPYKSWRHRYLWFREDTLKDYLLEHLQRLPYRGFGEFHIFGDDAASKPVEDMIELAKQRNLVLHPHTDLEGMQIILEKSGHVPVIWAHGGFNVPLNKLLELLDRYPNLYIELSLRDGMLDSELRLNLKWVNILTRYHDRFLVGMDTYKPSRWAELPEIIQETRSWLDQLPDKVAENIARNNLDRLFPH